MNKTIITYTDKDNLKNFENDFLYTLRNVAKFNGRVYCVYYGKKLKRLSKIRKRYGVEFFCKTEQKINFFLHRYLDFIEIINKLPPNADELMIIDGNDIWFQDKIDEAFELAAEGLGYVEDDSSALRDYNLGIIQEIEDKKLQKSIFFEIKNKPVINTGMFVGKKEKVHELIKKNSELLKNIAADSYPMDIPVINYLIRKEKKGIKLDEKFNFSLFLRRDKFIFKDYDFYCSDERKAVIIHDDSFVNRFFPDGRVMTEVPKFPEKLPGSFWGITAYFNPAGYKSKLKNYRKFRKESKTQGLKLIAVELAFRSKPFELKKDDADIVIQVRGKDVLFQKERLINVGIKNLPGDCDKFAWIDSDLLFLNNNWIYDTCRMLEKYSIVQLFSERIRLPKKINGKNNSFGKNYGISYAVSQLGSRIMSNPDNFFEMGIAWAARKKIFDKSGIYDKSFDPNSDSLLASLFLTDNFQEIAFSYTNGKIREDMMKWWEKIRANIKKSVYYTPGTILHLWHGSGTKRNYQKFIEIIRKYDFNPSKDTRINENGALEWASDKKGLHKYLCDYFYSRNEDDLILESIKSFFRDFNSNISFYLDLSLGKIGLFLKNNYPDLYYSIKKIQGKIFLYYDKIFKKYKIPIDKIFFDSWTNYSRDLFPKDRRMKVLFDKDVEGMSSENLKFLINEIVRRFGRDKTYLEIGTYKGSSLISAALYNRNIQCIGIDNFSQFNYNGKNREILNQNLSKFGLRNVEFYKGEYEEVLKKIFLKNPSKKIEIFFYDGLHSYDEQLEAFTRILPYLSERCVIIVDDTNWSQVRRANEEFIKMNPEFKSLFKIKTNYDFSPLWWNGVELIGRGF